MKFFFITAVLLICSCSSIPREEPFTVDLNSPSYPAGSAEAYIDKILSLGGSLSKTDIEASYYPIEDAVCLHFKVQYVDCKQFWDKDGREAFVNAFEHYKEDYEQRTLVKGSSRKTRRVYGSVPGYFVWKKTPVSVQAHGSPELRLGYHIKERAAFFSVTQMEAYFEDSISQQRDQTSAITILYFTRAQAENLATLFKQEYLQGLSRPRETGNAGVDEY